MKTDFNALIKWVENEIQMFEEIIKDKSTTGHFLTICNNNHEKLLLIKNYLNDYEKLANDYRALDKENSLLKLQKMELDIRLIFEDMKTTYRANRRKWRAKT